MSPFVALYLKELKGIRLVSAVLLFGTGAIVLTVISNAGDGGVHATMLLLLLPYLCPPALAGVLIHSITQEWAGSTQHQWLALPVPRSSLMLAKLAAVASLGAGIFVLNTFGLHMIYEQVLDTVGVSQEIVFQPPPGFPTDSFKADDLWSCAAAMFGSITLLLLGLGLAAAVLKTVVARFKGLVTVAVFLGGLWLTESLGPAFSDLVGGGETVSGVGLQAAVNAYLYLALMGAVFAAVGIFIFDRYVDA